MFRIGSFLFLESFLLGVCTLLTGTELIQDLLVLANGKEFILAAAVPVLLIGAVVSMFPLLPHKKQTAGEPFYLFFAQEFSVFILALLFFPLLILGGFPQDFSGRLLLGSGLIAAVISGTAAGLQSILNSEETMTVTFDGYDVGYKGVQAAVDAVNGKKLESFIASEGTVVGKDKAQEMLDLVNKRLNG